MTGNREFDILKVGGHSADDCICARAGDSQMDVVPLTDESQRLPVRRTSLSKILSRLTLARLSKARRSADAASERGILIIVQTPDTPAREPRFGAVDRVRFASQRRTRVAQDFPTKAGWSDVAPMQELLDFSKQMHVSLLTVSRLGIRVSSNAIPTCLGTFLSLKAS